MTEIWIFAIVFILLLILPILVANQYYKKRKGEVLFINQDKIRDARYFGKSFSSLIRENLQGVENNEIYLSRKKSLLMEISKIYIRIP